MDSTPTSALHRFQQSRAHRIGWLFKQMHKAVTTSIEEQLRAAGIELTRPQAMALKALAEHPGASNAELARMTSVSPQTMHQILQRLERDGLLVRRPHPQLGRVRMVEISEQGMALMARGLGLAQNAIEQVLGNLDEAEQEQLAALLQRCVSGAPSCKR